MRRVVIAALALLLLAAWAPEASAQKVRRFKPRKPLPYPQRVIGVGPVLASPPSAPYLAWRYGYRPLPPRRLRPLHPYRGVAPGEILLRSVVLPVPPVRIFGPPVRRQPLLAPVRPAPPLRPLPRGIPVRMVPLGR